MTLLTATLENVSFADGYKASGWFVYDPSDIVNYFYYKLISVDVTLTNSLGSTFSFDGPGSGVVSAVPVTEGSVGLGGAAATGMSPAGIILLIHGSFASIGTHVIDVSYTAEDTTEYSQDEIVSGSSHVFHNVNPGGSIVVTDTPPCFLAGTRIMTSRGETAVEDVEVGTTVPTRFSGAVPITWIGSRHIDCRRHPDPQQTYPIRISAGAFAKGQPRRDLWLSPDHAVFVDGVLTPAKLLVNGATIVREPRDQVTYYHVELARHDVLLAEGLPCETYLDTGNRGMFANGGAARILHPNFAVHAWDDTCAPMVLDGPILASVRQQLLKRAQRLGHKRRADPGLHVIIDGRAKRPGRRDGNRYTFCIPRGAKDVRLVSETGVPAELLASSLDARRLGVSIDRIVIHDSGGKRMLALDDPALADGWHAVECHGDYAWRWTDGNARLALPGPCRVEITVVGSLRGWVSARPREAVSKVA